MRVEIMFFQDISANFDANYVSSSRFFLIFKGSSNVLSTLFCNIVLCLEPELGGQRSFQPSLANSPTPPNCRRRQMKTNRRVTGTELIEREPDTTRMSALIEIHELIVNINFRLACTFCFCIYSI